MDIEKISYALPDVLLNPISELASFALISEIRIRLNKPLLLIIKGKKYFLNKKGQLTDLCSDVVIINENIITDVFARLCEYSLYSKEDMVNRGFIVMRNGCRAGICGAFSEKEFNLSSVQSINIRIANQIGDVDLPLYYLMNKKLCSVLISGPPCSGKTTMLRELCRRYSNLKYNVCVIDEKGEIAGEVSNASFDLGLCADVISYRKKSEGAEMALKYMNPDVIAYDELAEDINIIKSCAKSGVKMFATIHSDSIKSTCNKLERVNIDFDNFDLIVQLDKNNFNIIDSLLTGSVARC